MLSACIDARRRSRVLGRLAIAAAVSGLALVLARLAVPSATILAAVVVGLLAARWRPELIRVGLRESRAAQAVIGVVLGASLSAGTFQALGEIWLAVGLITLGGLACGVAIGLLLRRLSGLDIATAVLASVPGGAVGLILMARDLRADEPTVAFSQYLRILVILIATPLMATTVFAGSERQVSALTVDGTVESGTAATVVALALAAAGSMVASRTGAPAPFLLGPLVAAAAVSVTLPDLPLRMPAVPREVAFALVGLDIGLRFTPQAVTRVRRVAPALGVATGLTVAVPALFGALLAAGTPVSAIDGYLATTPGGPMVVAATAHGVDADVALVTAVQSVRLIVMLVAARALVRVTVQTLGRSRRSPTATGG